jgi:hypothetical protein
VTAAAGGDAPPSRAAPRVRPSRCALAASRRGDPLAASAAPASGYILVEVPGPWARHAVRPPALERRVITALEEVAATHSSRLLAVRRVTRAPAGRTRRLGIVDSRPGHERIAWHDVAADEDLPALAATGPQGGTDEPAFLVCTHGSHDPCCGTRGWPVARALAAARPEQTWQCSHIGGDRFAANVLVLPEGLYYGRLTPETAPLLVAAHEAGDVLPGHYRGRSAHGAPAQAAEHFARERLGIRPIDAVAPLAMTDLGHETWEVRLTADRRELSLVVRASYAEQPALLTCASSDPARARRWELVRLDD